MPITKADTARYPRTWVFDTSYQSTFGPATIGIAQANTTVSAVMPITVGVKVVKVGVSWLTATLANLPTFNIVYNTVQNLSAAQTYTQGNVAPMDNAYTGGVSAATGATLVGATPNNLQGQAFGSPGFANPALTTLAAGFQQVGGLGVPTNVAVDGQPLFNADVGLTVANFPGANATAGGQGVIIPTNWDAVYPAGIYPYGAGQVAAGLGPAYMATDFGACFTLRGTSPTTTVTGLTVTLFCVPILLAETVQSTTTITQPGLFF
jgi:hypothetical protein